MSLKLERCQIRNFKSLRQLDLALPRNLTFLMGRNNAGKSNILDCLNFLVDASQSLASALASRGGAFTEIVHRKQSGLRIEFVARFSLASDKRERLISLLFANNKNLSLKTVLESTFLRTVTWRADIGADSIVDELSVENFEPASRPCLVFQARADAHRTEITSGELETLCAAAHGSLPAETRIVGSLSGAGHELRLFLGQPPATGDFPVSRQIAGLVHQQFATLQWLDPHRHLPPRSDIHGESVLSPNASNLPDVLHWLHNNKPKHFRRIESEVSRLIPQLGRLYTPTSQTTATLAVTDTANDDLAYTLNQMSYGTKSAIAIITKVAMADPGTWLCLEEPESYLHPAAQGLLFNFLREEAKTKRIFVATHSTGLAATCPLESLFIVDRDPDNATRVTPVAESDVVEVISQLGITPSFDFEADAIVFVERSEDVARFEDWAGRFSFHARIQFLDAEEAASLRFHANARVVRSKFVHTLVFAALHAEASGSSGENEFRSRLSRHLGLPAAQIITLDFPPEAAAAAEIPHQVAAFFGTLDENLKPYWKI